MKFWTHNWSHETLVRTQQEVAAGLFRGLDHSAGERFGRVESGDTVFVVNWSGGSFRVLGRIIVDQVVDYRTAAKLLPYKPWPGTFHVMARRGTVMPLLFDAEIKDPARIQFISNGRVVYPKLTRGTPDQQAFRNVREITPSMADKFNTTLGLG